MFQQLTAAGFTAPVRRVLTHSIFVGLSLSVSELLLPFYLASLGYSTAEVGLFSTVARGAGMVSAIPLGQVIDRIGPQRSLRIGLAGYGAGWLLLLAAPNLPLMLAAQFLLGCLFLLAMSSAAPLMAALISDRQRSQVFAANEFMYVFVGLVGNTVAGQLPGWFAQISNQAPGDPAVYRLALACTTVLVWTALIPLIGRLRAAAAAAGTPTAAATALDESTISMRRMLRMALAAVFMGLSSGTVIPFQGLYLRETFGYSDSIVGVIIAACSLGAGIGALSGPLLVRRLGLRRGAGALRLAVAGGLALLLIPQPAAATAGFVLRAAFISASVAQSDALIIGMTPKRQRGRMMSILSLMWSAGWAVSSLAAGRLAPLIGFAPIFGWALICAIGSGISLWTLRSND
jgi:MFS family permease